MKILKVESVGDNERNQAPMIRKIGAMPSPNRAVTTYDAEFAERQRRLHAAHLARMRKEEAQAKNTSVPTEENKPFLSSPLDK